MNKFDVLNWNINVQPIPTVFTEGYTQYETLSKLIYQINQFIENMNLAKAEIDDLQLKKLAIEDYLSDLADKRHLSVDGDFTGTIKGLPIGYSDIGLATDWNSAKEDFPTLTDRLSYLFEQIYTKPILSLSSSPVATAFKKGTSISSTVLNLAITKKSKDVVRIDYKRNDSTIHTNNTPNSVSDSYTDSTPITTDTTFKCIVNDGKTDTTSNILTFTPVYQMYQGKVASSITSPNETDIKGLTEVVKTKQSITQSYTLANEKVVFSYPLSYGNLTSIIDKNGFNITSSFARTTVTMRMDDNTVQDFNIYTMLNPATVTDFNITFNF